MVNYIKPSNQNEVPNLQTCSMSIEQCRLIGIKLLQYRPHQRLANKTTAISDTVSLAETIQDTLFPIVEKQRYSMFAGRSLHQKYSANLSPGRIR